MTARRSERAPGSLGPWDPADIAGYKRLYEHTGNPIYAWEAYEIARANKLEVPEWVLGYFDDCAEGLVRITKKLGFGRIFSDLKKRRRAASSQGVDAQAMNVDVPAEIAKGLGFSRGRGFSTSFSQRAERNTKMFIGSHVAFRMDKHSESANKAAEQVAHEWRISDSTATRYYRFYESQRPKRRPQGGKAR